MAVCDVCTLEMLTAPGCVDVGYAAPHEGPERCFDCGCFHGGYHHPGCLHARCVVCDDQAMACYSDGEHIDGTPVTTGRPLGRRKDL
jgi:hypothetical protein